MSAIPVGVATVRDNGSQYGFGGKPSLGDAVSSGEGGSLRTVGAACLVEDAGYN